METLLDLVNTAKAIEHFPYPADVDERVARETELSRLGFYALAKQIEEPLARELKLHIISEHGYLCITPDAIKKFLETKAEQYNEQHERPPQPSLFERAFKGKNRIVFAPPVAEETISHREWYDSMRWSFIGAIRPIQYDDEIYDRIRGYRVPTVHRADQTKGTIGWYEWKKKNWPVIRRLRQNTPWKH